jgi:hypothetical protein
MSTATVMGPSLLERMQALIHAMNQLIGLERETQRVLKLPAEEFLDGIPVSMLGLEKEKETLMQLIDRLSTEVVYMRERMGQQDPYLMSQVEERNQGIRQVLQSLQRLHKESERILKLRLTLLTQDMHQMEQSRQFLRSALQSVAY